MNFRSSTCRLAGGRRVGARDRSGWVGAQRSLLRPLSRPGEVLDVHGAGRAASVGGKAFHPSRSRSVPLTLLAAF
jgi:hypothetical protein